MENKVQKTDKADQEKMGIGQKDQSIEIILAEVKNKIEVKKLRIQDNF